MDRIKKFLQKLTKKERQVMKKIMADIFVLNLESYDIKAPKGYKGVYRLRKGKIRVIFFKKNNKSEVIDLDYRKSIYR